jgi:hypothetical protein
LAILAEFAVQWLADADEDTSLWWVDAEDDVIGEIGAAFGISAGWALADLQIGAAMRERVPRLAALFLQGEISAKVMATVVDRTVLVCDDDAVALIDAACVEAAQKCGWSGLSYYKLKNAVDVWVDRYDPEAVRRVRANVRGREVKVGDDDKKSGTTTIYARLTTPGAALVMGRLRRMAKGVCGNDPRTPDQRMADALEASAADADHLKFLCGSAACEAAADDGVASHYEVHLYAEAAVVDGPPDPLIHGKESVEEPLRPFVKVKYPTKKTAADPAEKTEAAAEADAAAEDAESTADTEPATEAESAENPESVPTPGRNRRVPGSALRRPPRPPTTTSRSRTPRPRPTSRPMSLLREAPRRSKLLPPQALPQRHRR